MFDEQQRPKTKLNIKAPLIALACAGGGLLLSFGLCGAAAATAQYHLQFFGRAGLALFGLSLIAILVGVVWLLVVALINAIRR